MNECMHAWMDGWVDGCLSVCLYVYLLHISTKLFVCGICPGTALVFKAKASEPLLGSERQKDPTVSATLVSLHPQRYADNKLTIVDN
jgi:hypothetical protein